MMGHRVPWGGEQSKRGGVVESSFSTMAFARVFLFISIFSIFCGPSTQAKNPSKAQRQPQSLGIKFDSKTDKIYSAERGRVHFVRGKDYQQILIDQNRDGRIDEWFMFKKNQTYHAHGLSYWSQPLKLDLQVRRPKDKVEYKFIFDPRKNEYRLVSAQTHRYEVLNSTLEVGCAKEDEPLKAMANQFETLVKGLSGETDRAKALDYLEKNSKYLLDDSCKTGKFNQETFQALKEAYADVIASSFAPAEGGQGKHIQCLKDLKLLGYAYKIETGLALGGGSQMGPWLFTPAQVMCVDDGKSGKSGSGITYARYKEDPPAKIELLRSVADEGSKEAYTRQVSNSLLHEWLHHAGLKDESLTHMVADCCSAPGEGNPQCKKVKDRIEVRDQAQRIEGMIAAITPDYAGTVDEMNKNFGAAGAEQLREEFYDDLARAYQATDGKCDAIDGRVDCTRVKNEAFQKVYDQYFIGDNDKSVKSNNTYGRCYSRALEVNHSLGVGDREMAVDAAMATCHNIATQWANFSIDSLQNLLKDGKATEEEKIQLARMMAMAGMERCDYEKMKKELLGKDLKAFAPSSNWEGGDFRYSLGWKYGVFLAALGYHTPAVAAVMANDCGYTGVIPTRFEEDVPPVVAPELQEAANRIHNAMFDGNDLSSVQDIAKFEGTDLGGTKVGTRAPEERDRNNEIATEHVADQYAKSGRGEFSSEGRLGPDSFLGRTIGRNEIPFSDNEGKVSPQAQRIRDAIDQNNSFVANASRMAESIGAQIIPRAIAADGEGRGSNRTSDASSAAARNSLTGSVGGKSSASSPNSSLSGALVHADASATKPNTRAKDPGLSSPSGSRGSFSQNTATISGTVSSSGASQASSTLAEKRGDRAPTAQAVSEKNPTTPANGPGGLGGSAAIGTRLGGLGSTSSDTKKKPNSKKSLSLKDLQSFLLGPYDLVKPSLKNADILAEMVRLKVEVTDDEGRRFGSSHPQVKLVYSPELHKLVKQN